MNKCLNGFVLMLMALLLTGTCASAQTAVWQWSVLVKNARENNGQARAFLWIPPHCKQVKAFVFAQNNMEEQSILENPQFRLGMARLGIAEVWVSPSFNHLFNFAEGAGEEFTAIMNDLAEASGYAELSYAPFIGMGHSAAASAPYYMAAWKPERALAAISVSGQWPYFRHPAFAPDIWEDRNIDYVPCLETMGEYEAADTWATEGLKERQAHPLMPLSMLASPAQGHFAATSKKCAYIAMYIKKAMQYRLPASTAPGQAPQLIPINPKKTGWLVDKWRFDQQPTAAPAPVGQYQGDPNQAFWFFDEEMARATTAYEAEYRHKKPQLIGYVQQATLVEQRNTHQQVNLKFEPEADGITFKLRAAFYNTVPGGSPRPTAWAVKPIGAPLGHANGGNISIDPITGPVIKLNDSTFRLQPQRGYWENTHSYELWFAATHPGDAEYKPAVQQAQMVVPSRNSKGKAKHITFLPIPNQTIKTKKIKLQATSDAGVPVFFYVLDGPARLKGDELNLTAIPPRSKYPVSVTVVAWQYGNSTEPKLQTATPVERTFLINK